MKTKRLWIKHPKPSDFKQFKKLRNSEFTLKYNALNFLTEDRLSEAFACDLVDENCFYIRLQENDEVVGSIYFEEDSLRYNTNALTVSYYMDEDYAGQGIMSEALREVLFTMFQQRDISLISARVFKENIASIKLLKKLGFKQEGILRRAVRGYQDIIYDDCLFSIFENEIT